MPSGPPKDLSPAGFKDPYTLFAYLVPAGGRALVTAPEERSALIRLGYVAEETAKDLRMLGLGTEGLDAIWWSDASAKYSIEDAFRIFQSLFRGLRAKSGILVFSFSKEAWNTRTVMTLLRQTGFQLFHTFENTTDHLYFCERV